MLIRNNPWQLLNELNSIFDGTARLSATDDSKVESGRWTPAVDFKEQADKFSLYVDIPGVDPKDIEISMDNNVLTLRGVREEQSTESTDTYHRVERIKGNFYRRFTLPDTADSEHITATSKHGVLEVTIGKKKALQARKIEIQSEK